MGPVPSKAAPYIAAAGAIGGTWLIDNWGELGAGPAAPRQSGMNTALEASATHMPCGLPRLSSVTTLTGAQIRQLPSGAGEDFIRELAIQRASITNKLGTLVPGLERPKLTARCAQEWIGIWLDAWQVANAANPKAFAIARPPPPPDSPSWWQLTGPWSIVTAPLYLGDALKQWNPPPAGPWHSTPAPSPASSLGRAWQHLRELHAEAAAANLVTGTVDFLAGLFGADTDTGERVWVGARKTTDALMMFAQEMDAAGFNLDTDSALAQLRRDLHPLRFVEKAVDVVVTPIELATQHVVGPVLSATVGALATTLLPWIVVGGAVYILARRAGL